MDTRQAIRRHPKESGASTPRSSGMVSMFPGHASPVLQLMWCSENHEATAKANMIMAVVAKCAFPFCSAFCSSSASEDQR